MQERDAGTTITPGKIIGVKGGTEEFQRTLSQDDVAFSIDLAPLSVHQA